MNTWALAAQSSGVLNGDGNHRDVDLFVTSPSHNASPNQALAGAPDATATRDQHIHIWSPSTANNGWHPDVSFAPQSLSHVTPGPFTPACSWADYPPMYSNAIGNGQPDPTLRFPDVGVYNAFSVMPNGFRNGFVNPTPYAQRDALTSIDSQETMASYNQFPLPTTTSMPAASALPIHATSMSTTPAVPRPIARGVISRRSNVNTNAHACGYARCRKLFARPGDLARHSKQHGVPEHPCDIPGCNRHGLRAFYRADKLLDHQRKKHGRGN
jgi:hypothetical protein